MDPNQDHKVPSTKMETIKSQAAKMGTSYYKYVEPFIINIQEKIGRGSYGEVFKGADTRTGQLIAVKTICTSNIKKDPEKFYQSLTNQIEIMKAIKHCNIVELYDVKKSANNIYLFVELCDKGSLDEVLKKRRKLPESEVLIIAKQLVSGYKYLHERSVIHRDLKPANILIKNETYKIADFGFAKYFGSGEQDIAVLKSLVGSPMYMCPEILNGSKYSTKSDVWSLGVIFYQMLFGKTPHKASNLEELVSKVNKNKIRFPQKLTNVVLQELLENMLRYDPEERIAWKDIFALEMFQDKKVEVDDFKQSMNIAQKRSGDKLEISQRMNQIYFQNKKVIQPIELTNAESEKEMFEPHQNGGTDIYKSIEARYEKREVRKDVVRKIKNWFLFKRNKAVFLNHLSLKIHNCFALNLIATELSTAEQFILVLSKWQCMITFKSYMRLKEGKINNNAFTEEEYKIFIGNSVREKILEKFKNDFTVMKMFFDELMKKVDIFLNSLPELSEPQKRIKSICNQSLCPKEIFGQIYSETIDSVWDVCLKSVARFPTSIQIRQLTYLVSQALKLKKTELNTNEYLMIYEAEEKLSLKELQDKIDGKSIQSLKND